MAEQPVRTWRETITIPTYGIGEPDPNPMFLEKRVYQGSSGKVYPHPVIDRIEDEKHDRPWEAVFLENEYLKIMVLPELGGRIQMALDKTNDYHFVYYNRVIKPALVGLAGPWISGGIEFNWPQHHRPNTFGPVEATLQDNGDGSHTLWCSEIDRMYRTKGMHGVTLYPGKAYLEIKVRLFNATDLPQTFLWWANPAISVDDNHQSIFPPDVHAVMDHGKRDSISFPVARGTYYKVDYSPGTDISRYKNIPVPTSYMAYHSDYDFVGSYDHGRRAGLLHVCSHHISPGKKQWTWGNGEFGHAWDRHLTDADGPYIELMCGVYTDNQPDFSWLMPGEEKRFSQYFMPYKGVGVVRNANIDAAVGLDVEAGRAAVRVYTTSPRPCARVTLTRGETVLLDETFDGSPASWFEATADLPADIDETTLRVAVFDAVGRELIAWRPHHVDRDNIPDPAQPIGEPTSLDSVESLYLAGLHLEQYRHATREPADYYAEGLRRDPGDARCNNAYGRLLIRRGDFEQAALHLRRAVERLIRHNPNPYDGEPYYNLGVACEYRGKYDEAIEAYYKATWNAAWQVPGYFAIARLHTRAGELDLALERTRDTLRLNGSHHRARHLEIALLRRLGQTDEADQRIGDALAEDPFNFGVLWEQAEATGDTATFDERMRDAEHNYIELAIHYAAAGLYEAAAAVLGRYLDRAAPAPMALYHRAYAWRQLGRGDQAEADLQQAAACDPRLCFPNRLEDIAVLRDAIAHHPDDARAPYYLGNLWYDKQQHGAAIDCWERAVKLDAGFPTAWRNLGIARFNKRGDGDGAWAAYQQAFANSPGDARVLFELDQIAKRLGHLPGERLARLEQHMSLVTQRDDLYLEYVTLVNLAGRHAEALEAVLARPFHPWEGGEGKVPGQYLLALTELAREAIDAGRYDEATTLLERARTWPRNLGEGKLAGNQENDVHYLLGLARRGKGDEAGARASFEKASVGIAEPTSPTEYHDQPPDMIFYQGLALRELGREDEAKLRFEKLVEYGRAHLGDKATIPYFAVSLPDFLIFEEDPRRRHELHCRYMMALGLLGLGREAEAVEQFDAVLAAEPSHLGAWRQVKRLGDGARVS